MASTTIRVTEASRERLKKIGERYGHSSLEKVLEQLLAEHEELEAQRRARLELSEERLAEINRRRATPTADMVALERMVELLDERTAAEST